MVWIYFKDNHHDVGQTRHNYTLCAYCSALIITVRYVTGSLILSNDTLQEIYIFIFRTIYNRNRPPPPEVQ